MSWALAEFYAAVAEEFGVAIGEDDRDYLPTPRAVIDHVVETATPRDMGPEEWRDHVAAVVGEIMAQSLGITRYSEDSRFVEDLRVG